MLIQKLDTKAVLHAMLAENLLNKKEFLAIMDASSDHFRSQMILELIYCRPLTYLFSFISLLENIGSQKHLYANLINGKD